MPNTVASYTVRPGALSGPISMRRGGVSSFYIPDMQGTTRQLTDASQNVTDTLVTDAWGREVASTGTTVNPYKSFGKWGYYRDAANRQYVRARHLRNDLGRWVSRDPIGFAGGEWNLYGYLENGPVVVIDPSGLQIMCPIPCCCCVNTLKITRIANINRPNRFGHTFYATASMSHHWAIGTGESPGDCTLKWYEKQANPAESYSPPVPQKDKYVDILPLHPELFDWPHRKPPCPGPERFNEPDLPAEPITAGRAVFRNLCFRIIVLSSPHCNCQHRSREVWAHQVLRLINGRIVTQRFVYPYSPEGYCKWP
jgi:RHS repeat-associated protein